MPQRSVFNNLSADPRPLAPESRFKNIAPQPQFWPERTGDVVPRHSVYYLVPASSTPFDELLAYLNGSPARQWMHAHCQRAANGFMRLQSRVLRDLPVPKAWSSAYQTTFAF